MTTPTRSRRWRAPSAALLRADARAVARIVLGGLVLLFAFTAVYVAAFHAPRPKGLDVGVVGTRAQAAAAQSALDGADRGGFDVRRYDTEPRARAGLLDTDVHAVLVPGPTGDRVLVAQAQGAVPTQAAGDALRGVAARSHTAAAVEDLRPLPASDSRGLSSLFTVIGTLIPSVVFGVLLSVFGRRYAASVRWTAVVAYAVLAGVVVAFNVDVLVGALSGDFAGIAVVAGLLALAVSAAAHGLGHLGGPVGIVLAIATLILLGMSAAGGAVTYEFEPGFYGALSQLLPPGAALTAVRNVHYFDWASTLVPLIVLGAWAFGGLVLGLLGERYGPHVRNAPA
jgi:hypothetical protein